MIILKKIIYIRDLRIRGYSNLVRLDEATEWQKKNCDRIVMNKEGKVIREITHEDLMLLDREMKNSPTNYLVGAIAPTIKNIRDKFNIERNFFTELNSQKEDEPISDMPNIDLTSILCKIYFFLFLSM